MRYIKGTLQHGLLFKKATNFILEGYTDADWASDVSDRRSTSGYSIFHGDNLVQWSSRKQLVVSLSSTEAEYRALCQAATELVWIQHLFQELGININTTPILWCNNMSARALSSNPVFDARTKHIEIDVHYVRKLATKKRLVVQYVGTEYQVADILTKALPGNRFQCLREKLKPISIISFTSTFTDSAKYGYTPMSFGNVVDQFHNEYCVTSGTNSEDSSVPLVTGKVINVAVMLRSATVLLRLKYYVVVVYGKNVDLQVWYIVQFKGAYYAVAVYGKNVDLQVWYIVQFKGAYWDKCTGRLATICIDDRGNFTSNSTYEKNRNLILSSLAPNVTLHDGYFYTASVGQEPDEVYALALCRGDSSAEQCVSGVSFAAEDIMRQCLNQKEAVAWGEGPKCIVRYSDHSIFGKMETYPWAEGGYGTNITTNMTQFDQTWKSLMNRLLKTSSTGSNNSRKKFATGEASLTDSVKIYALMQCTPDISESDFDSCLRQSVFYCESHYHGKAGCLLVRPSCIYEWDSSPFYAASPDAPSPSPPPSQFTHKEMIIKEKGGIASKTVFIIVVSTVISVALVAFTCVLLWRRTRKTKRMMGGKQTIEDDDNVESLQFDFSTIRVATNNFSIDNKLGRGGFGVVYKGRLLDGQEVAVKRLAIGSVQGETEFKNEVLLMAKLQHRNLVRLLGFCLEGNEKLLIYEFVPNSSLDNFIYDPTQRLILDWKMRYKIIKGIARGILYIHEDSRFRVIHRDLKANNVLLDVHMTLKVSDFGMAKLLAIDQTQGHTSRIAGTFGYMALEYIKHGHFSAKSDVFSFGVLLLEIMSCQKNSSFPTEEEPQDLLTYAWRNWIEGKAVNLIDPNLRVGSNRDMMRCIHIGLLCVQENVANRPTMASVVHMLTGDTLSIPTPSKPAFFMHFSTTTDKLESTALDQSKNFQFSLNEASITDSGPR
ncbi:cysteine-rich receptor-like protein kinase 18 [Pistacia vera]|uniref:cysteine-rich receptor-like protein kinase 18 n=1 Tax=Pistacia vera TaxID=55513 RepID=UPI001262B37C|nr:cysteine-rich receptor-like protein kinase 18 [Pistacia vera]